MIASNKNIKEQRTARTFRLKAKAQATNQHSQNFNQLHFQLPEPHKFVNSYNLNITALKASQDKCKTSQTYDARRVGIKEKIKFRIKQELWNLLKKNNDKQEILQLANQNSQALSNNPVLNNSSFSYIKGKSVTRFGRDSEHAKKNWSMVSSSCKNLENERSKTSRENILQQKKSQRRRAWSSVKMKQGDRAIVLKKTNAVRKNSFSLQKFQVLQIQPWYSPNDSEHQLE